MDTCEPHRIIRSVTPFLFECQLRGTTDFYWRAFFDDDCAREQYDLIGVRHFEVVDRRDDGATLTRSVRVVPKRDFPLFFRKVFGASLGFVETTTFHRERGFAETSVIPDMMASRTHVSGSHRVRTLPSGDLVRSFEGKVGVSVPLVGKRIERFVLDDIEKSYGQSTEVTQVWMDRWLLEADAAKD